MRILMISNHLGVQSGVQRYVQNLLLNLDTGSRHGATVQQSLRVTSFTTDTRPTFRPSSNRTANNNPLAEIKQAAKFGSLHYTNTNF